MKRRSLHKNYGEKSALANKRKVGIINSKLKSIAIWRKENGNVTEIASVSPLECQTALETVADPEHRGDVRVDHTSGNGLAYSACRIPKRTILWHSGCLIYRYLCYLRNRISVV
jgi:hypothetical protein